MTTVRYVVGVARVRRSRGFSLIEVVVAFALLALALTVLLSVLSSATRQVRHSGEISRASLYAQSLLSQAGVGEPLRAGRTAGTFEQGRYRWTLEVAPYEDPGLDLDGSGHPYRVQLHQLTLDMRWGDGAGQAMRWRTLRLVPDGGGR